MLRSSLVVSLFFCGSYLLSPQIAFGEEVAAAIPQVADAAASTEAKSEIKEPTNFVAAGQPLTVGTLTLTPPTGWDVATNVGGLSVIMESPKVENAKPGDIKYRRNITVATIHRPSPIDDRRANELKEEMVKNYSKNSVVADFKVLEHKFFNFKGQNDGLIVYTQMTIDSQPLMQVHLLYSGSEKQFLFTYTDLASNLADQANPNFAEAWASMTAISIPGVAPDRMQQYAGYGAGLGASLFMVGLLGLIRRRASRKDYMADADQFMADGEEDFVSGVESTLAHGWRIKRNNRQTDEDYDDLDCDVDADIGDERGREDNELPETKYSSNISNF